MSAMSALVAEARRIEDQIVQWRRDFHKYPELRFKEVRTARIVAEHLSNLGMDVQTGIGRTGVVGLMKGEHDGPVVLMRFDMDALPIQEENTVDYASQIPGVMHACGHDTHVAMGLGVATLLSQKRSQIHGAVKFVFQPAEEGAGGARAMIADGVLEDPRPDYTLGIHIDAQRPVGLIAIGKGPILAAADAFEITVTGRGGHGALPEQTIDALIVGTNIVNAIQTVISRNVGLLDSALISVCEFHAGSAFNVIPEIAEISGTIRTYDSQIQATVHRRIRELASGIAQSFGAVANTKINQIVPAAVNDPQVTDVVRSLAADIFGAENIETSYRVSPSDDIAEFLQAAPGVQVILGAALKDNFPHHNPRFNIDESVMPLGVAILCGAALHYLSALGR